MTTNAERPMPHDWEPVSVKRPHSTKRDNGYACACGEIARCPHGCGPLQWADDSWICPKCGDEWHDAETFGPCPAQKAEDFWRGWEDFKAGKPAVLAVGESASYFDGRREALKVEWGESD